jgi:hypothetical protein
MKWITDMRVFREEIGTRSLKMGLLSDEMEQVLHAFYSMLHPNIHGPTIH